MRKWWGLLGCMEFWHLWLDYQARLWCGFDQKQAICLVEIGSVPLFSYALYCSLVAPPWVTCSNCFKVLQSVPLIKTIWIVAWKKSDKIFIAIVKVYVHCIEILWVLVRLSFHWRSHNWSLPSCLNWSFPSIEECYNTLEPTNCRQIRALVNNKLLWPVLCMGNS